MLTPRIRSPLHVLILDVVNSDHPGGAFAGLGGRQDLVGNQAPHSRFAYLERHGRFLERDLAALSALPIAIGWNTTVIA